MIKNTHYAPVKVSNPASLQHLVRVKMGQAIQIRLDEKLYPDPKLEIATQNIALISEKKENGWTIFELAQHPDVFTWANYSSSMLSDVWIDSNNMSGRIIVMLDCNLASKKRVVTVVNPDCTDVRLQAGEVLEVILYDLNFESQDDWSWEWKSNLDVSVKPLGFDTLCLYTWHQYYEHMDNDRPECLYARYPRAVSDINPWCRQHHRWFCFGDEILNLLENEDGIKHIGSFHFFGWENRYNRTIKPSECHLAIYIDLNKKRVNQVVESLALPLKSKWDYTTQGKLNSNALSYTPNAMRRHKSLYVSSISIKEVEVKLMEKRDIGHGCAAISAEPPTKLTPHDYCFDDEDLLSCANHPSNWPGRFRNGFNFIDRD